MLLSSSSSLAPQTERETARTPPSKKHRPPAPHAELQLPQGRSAGGASRRYSTMMMGWLRERAVWLLGAGAAEGVKSWRNWSSICGSRTSTLKDFSRRIDPFLGLILSLPRLLTRGTERRRYYEGQ